MQIITEKCLPTIPMKRKRCEMSSTSESILEQRRDAAEQHDTAQFDNLTKRFQKQRRLDRKENILDTLRSDLDTRDRWMGIKQLKSEYKPTPYQRRDRQGTHIHKDLRAEQAAEYLRKHHWGKDGMEQ